jgi:glycosyltransferase involved in cell wall biosynthesis
MTTPDEMYKFAGLPEPVGPDEDVCVCAPGTAAEFPFGVEYRGPHETIADGTNRAVRLNARALAETGMPVLLTSFAYSTVDENGVLQNVFDAGLPQEIEAEVGPLRRTNIGAIATRILHMVVHNADHLARVLTPPSFSVLDIDVVEAILSNTIVFSVWERDRIDQSIVSNLNRCGQLWVPCEQNREMLVASGVREWKVKVVPHPFDADSDMAKLVRRKPTFKPAGGAERRYYSIGHWQPRKGFHELVGAFLCAFTPSDDTSLTIKYGGGEWKDYPSPQQSSAQWLVDSRVRRNGWTRELFDKKVKLIGGRISDNQILKLHFDNNIYVSASHGEAWNLGAFDAKVAGNTLVHVPWGGTSDFDDVGRDAIVPYHMAQVHSSYRWEAGAQWAEYDFEDLVSAVKDTQSATYARSSKFDHLFSLKNVGSQIKQNVLDLLEQNNPVAHTELSK